MRDIRLVAGRPSLDFVNTIHDRTTRPPDDYLVDDEAWLDWSARAGLLTPAERRRIAARGAASAVDLPALRRFREQLHAIFVARIQGVRPPAAALAGLGAWAHRAWRERRLQSGEAGVRWVDARVDGELPARRIALDAVQVLEAVPRERLKRCATIEGCGWLFVDDSKNNSRTWCDMDTCGAIAKMRRYRARTRG